MFIPTGYEKETIVVGNGPSVVEKKNGYLIDSFGTVVRMNRFCIYSGDIDPIYTGWKTDVWATKRIYNSDVDFSRLRTVLFMLINHKHSNNELDKIRKKIGENAVNVIRYPNSLSTKYENKMRKYVEQNKEEILKYTKGSGRVCPSTGLYVLAYYLSILPRVYVTGIDLMKAGKIHYFGDDVWANWTHVSKANVHPAEKWLFEQLMETGRVCVLK